MKITISTVVPGHFTPTAKSIEKIKPKGWIYVYHDIYRDVVFFEKTDVNVMYTLPEGFIFEKKEYDNNLHPLFEGIFNNY